MRTYAPAYRAEAGWVEATENQLARSWRNPERVEPAIGMREDGRFLLYPGKQHAFIGESESCKTWGAILIVAQELAAGHNVVWVDTEGDFDATTERLRYLGSRFEDYLAHFKYVNPLGQISEEFHDRFMEWQPSLTVIDSTNGFLGLYDLDPNSAMNVEAAYEAARYHFGSSAQLFIDHVTKAQGSNGRWASGSERKISGLNGAAFVFDVKSRFGHGQEARANLKVSKDRHGFIRGAGDTHLWLSANGDGTVVQGEFRPTRTATPEVVAAVETGRARRMVEEYLATNPVASQNRTVEALKNRGVTQTELREAYQAVREASSQSSQR